MDEQLPKIFTVTKINTMARLILEANFTSVFIVGEISNLVQPSSGHFYFSLKDEGAQIKAVMFHHKQTKLKFLPKNGLQVVVNAQISLYEPRGDYQLIVQHMEVSGIGALQAQFLQVKAKLEAEGLFAPQHKKPIPKNPQIIGIITSATGAVIHDILTILQRRQPDIAVIIYPTLVQGEQAPKQIADAIALANHRQECEVLIVARGGGSLEDLWSFNEEIVARAIFASQIPIISAVGHETDITIADFVADLRASTPSAAAELIAPNIIEHLQIIKTFRKKLEDAINHRLQSAAWQLQALSNLLRHPSYHLNQQIQKLDYLETQLRAATLKRLQNCQYRYAMAIQNLELVSPLAILQRGYAIVTNHDRIIRSAKEIVAGDKIQVRLADGSIICLVC